MNGECLNFKFYHSEQNVNIQFLCFVRILNHSNTYSVAKCYCCCCCPCECLSHYVDHSTGRNEPNHWLHTIFSAQVFCAKVRQQHTKTANGRRTTNEPMQNAFVGFPNKHFSNSSSSSTSLKIFLPVRRALAYFYYYYYFIPFVSLRSCCHSHSHLCRTGMLITLLARQ